MTARAPDLTSSGPTSELGWRGQEHRIDLRGATYRLRLVHFPAGWLASVDTVEGPTLGCNASPYLAVSRAIEPIGGGLIDAMTIVPSFRLVDQMSAVSSVVPSLFTGQSGVSVGGPVEFLGS